jgi:hypothetical protein
MCLTEVFGLRVKGELQGILSILDKGNLLGIFNKHKVIHGT